MSDLEYLALVSLNKAIKELSVTLEGEITEVQGLGAFLAFHWSMRFSSELKNSIIG